MSLLIYHITHIKNLPSIIKAEGLLAKSFQNGINYTNIAHQGIQYRRANTRVPCSVGGISCYASKFNIL